ERELIGNFLLKMAEKQVVSARSGWFVDKYKLRCEFRAHLLDEPNGNEMHAKLSSNNCAYNIGSLLQRTNFLMNTPRGNSNYRIKDLALMEFRKEKYNAMDERQRQNDCVDVSDKADNSIDGSITQKLTLDENAESVPLMYQKTQKQQRNADFELSSLGCYICQSNFDSIEKYEEHIEYHGDESDFESLRAMAKNPEPMIKLSYQTCVDSHYFAFTLETQLKQQQLTIEKFIIVQSRQFYYVSNNRLLDVDENQQTDRQLYFVDSHVFMILREQPIVICFSQLVNGQRQHYVEQHHFMRTEALPKANFNVNPYRLSSKKLFRSGRLEPAIPPPAVVSAVKRDAYEAEQRLVEFNKEYRNYCELQRQFTLSNIFGTLRTLLQVEDIERLQCYVALKQSKMELHQFGKELSVKLQPNARNISAEDVLSPGDDVLIINERSQTVPQTELFKANSMRQLLDNNGILLELALKDFDALIEWGRKMNELFGQPEKERREPRVYFARVLGVSAQRVNITCDRHLPENTTYSLVFRPVRAVLRYQYRALNQLKLTTVEHVQRLLFPPVVSKEPLALGALCLHNACIGTNPEQHQAVQQIALCKKLPAPYIVFGPPGTGKTATICEAIYQLFVRRPETHILVLAGSNTACDEIALRLLRAIANANLPTQPRPLTRIFAASCDRRIDNIDDLLLEYSNMYALHFYPHVQTVHDYRIVVCTLSLAGKLSTGGFGRDENKQSVFSHVFVDEAAASTEAEVLMGITCTMAASTNLILSGDHKQLGPVLQSQRAGDWGLAVSLFDRLLQRECYRLDENGDYNVAVQTRLRRNYRSHPEIVSLYSNLYYNSELQSEAALENVCLAKNWFHTPNENFPIMFHSVFGTTMNAQSSLSLCNNKEIDAVMDYVKDLMYFGIDGEKLKQTDIGIISPYKNQYQRIQEQLNMRNWHHIDCGSVELFQGKEKQIIIVSFVRSFTEKLGFLNNSRRLNVLLSRPMSLLILIGNPRTLSKNDEFRHIIDMCRDRKTLVGAPYFPDDVKLNEANLTPNTPRSTGPRQTQTQSTASEDLQSLGQTLKRSNNHYNHHNPYYQRNQRNSTELDKLFEELPSVPRFVDNESEAVRSIRAQIQALKMQQKSASTATTPIPEVLKSPTVSPTAAAATAARPATVTVTATRATFSMQSQPLSDRASEAFEVLHIPSAPPASPGVKRATQYSHIPTGSARFHNPGTQGNGVPQRTTLPPEYARPPPFYYRAHIGQPTPSAPPPREEKKKSNCVIS
ncbi:CG6701, partial [Drosophila busckii]